MRAGSPTSVLSAARACPGEADGNCHSDPAGVHGHAGDHHAAGGGGGGGCAARLDDAGAAASPDVGVDGVGDMIPGAGNGLNSWRSLDAVRCS